VPDRALGDRGRGTIAAMGTRLKTVVLGIAGLGIACAGVPAASAADVSAVPRLGQCYNYSFAKGTAASSSPTPAVSCTKHHTAQTYYVGKFTGAAKASSGPKSGQVLLAVGYACDRELYAKLGAKVALTRAFLAAFWFVPTAAQWKAGARFFRCDAALYRDNPKQIQAIPAGFTKALKTKAGLKRYAWCFTTTYATVPCTAKHATKALTYVTLGRVSAKYPGDNAIASRTNSMCTKAVDKISKKSWVGVYWRPNSAGWRFGIRTATCFQTG
jgi:Septum formation